MRSWPAYLQPTGRSEVVEIEDDEDDQTQEERRPMMSITVVEVQPRTLYSELLPQEVLAITAEREAIL